MNILERPNKKGDKIYFLYDYGRGPGQRPSTGIFIYTTSKSVYYGDTGPAKTEDIGPGQTESLGHFPVQFYGNDLILSTKCLFLS